MADWMQLMNAKKKSLMNGFKSRLHCIELEPEAKFRSEFRIIWISTLVFVFVCIAEFCITYADDEYV